MGKGEETATVFPEPHKKMLTRTEHPVTCQRKTIAEK